jgi:hypothetical protein
MCGSLCALEMVKKYLMEKEHRSPRKINQNK